MTAIRPAIACLGAGRMGRGIAVAFAYAGHAVTMIDVKARSAEQFAALEAEALLEPPCRLVLLEHLERDALYPGRAGRVERGDPRRLPDPPAPLRCDDAHPADPALRAAPRDQRYPHRRAALHGDA